ncbi:hypothetical protein KEM56_003678 [Ascosphaera pollenicola]|nr:hypothetical protein KEM56_003678 [Ascosphaera pollenicola]
MALGKCFDKNNRMEQPPELNAPTHRDSTDPYIGSIVNAHTNLTEISQTLDLLWRNDIPSDKAVMGIGFYGRSFTLADPNCDHAGCPFAGGGNPGKCSDSPGTLMYSEINDIISRGAKFKVDNDAGVAIVIWDTNQWVSYDNNQTLKMKMDYANKKCLGGLMVWAASEDDTTGTAVQARNFPTSRQIPIMALVVNNLATLATSLSVASNPIPIRKAIANGTEMQMRAGQTGSTRINTLMTDAKENARLAKSQLRLIRPAPPTEGDIKLCPTPADLSVNIGSMDSDCTLYEVPHSFKRSLELRNFTLHGIDSWDHLHDIQETTEDAEAMYESLLGSPQDENHLSIINETLVPRDLHMLVPRGRGRLISFCAPGQATSILHGKSYPHYRRIASLAGRGFMAAARPAVCGAIGVASYLTEPANLKFVTEHVFEFQAFRDYLILMIEGKLPGGKPLSAGAAVATGIFDPNGEFLKKWPANINVPFGTTPEETFLGALGHLQAPANYDNFQACEENINSMKARITQGKRFVSPQKWAESNPLEKVAILQVIINTFDYWQHAQVTTSYNSVFRAIKTAFTIFATLPNAQQGYDYAQAFEDIAKADFEYKTSYYLSLFLDLARDAQNEWMSATLPYIATVVTQNQNAIADFIMNAQTYIKFDYLNMFK